MALLSMNILLQDKTSKQCLIHRIQCRRSALQRLWQMDRDKFAWLLQELKIRYVPPVDYPEWHIFEHRKKHKRAIRTTAAVKVLESKCAAWFFFLFVGGGALFVQLSKGGLELFLGYQNFFYDLSLVKRLRFFTWSNEKKRRSTITDRLAPG